MSTELDLTSESLLRWLIEQRGVDPLADVIAALDSREQARFIVCLARELRALCGWRLAQQLSHVADALRELDTESDVDEVIDLLHEALSGAPDGR